LRILSRTAQQRRSLLASTAHRFPCQARSHVAVPGWRAFSISTRKREALSTDSLVTSSSELATSPLTETIVQNVDLSTAAVQAALQFGDLKALGLCNWTPVGAVQEFLELVSISTGLPWWGTIALATVVIRTALLPVVIKLQRNTTLLQRIKPEMDIISAKLKRAKEDNDHYAVQATTYEMQTLLNKHGAKLGWMFAAPLLQAPVMISFFMALRKMSQLEAVPGFSTGGLWWFTDLNLADPTYILPVSAGLGFLAIFELGSENGGGQQQMTRQMKMFFRLMSVGMVPFTASLPSSVFVYWTVSNLFSIFQILAFKNPAIRQRLNIPRIVQHPLAFKRTQ